MVTDPSDITYFTCATVLTASRRPRHNDWRPLVAALTVTGVLTLCMPSARATPSDQKPAWSLASVAGRWSAGDCRNKYYDYSIQGNEAHFRDQSGASDVERITDVRNDGFSAVTVSSSSSSAIGTRWSYTFNGGQVRIEDLKTGRRFMQRRCELDATQAAAKVTPAVAAEKVNQAKIPGGIVREVMRGAGAGSRIDYETSVTGTMLRLSDIGDQHFLLSAGGIDFGPAGESPRFQGIYGDGSQTYVLLSEGGGLGACRTLYRVIDLSGQRPVLSPQFGSCSDGPIVALTSKGLRVTTPAIEDVAQQMVLIIHDQVNTCGLSGEACRSSEPELAEPGISDGMQDRERRRSAAEPAATSVNIAGHMASGPGSRDVRFDRPSADLTTAAPDSTAIDGSKRTISCVTYSTFMVRETGGDSIGSDSLSVSARPAAGTPRCTVAGSSSERALADYDGYNFVGAAGRFLLLVWPDGSNAGTGFAIFDAVTGHKLYSDTVRVTAAGLGFSRFLQSADGNTLELRYQRVVDAQCSLADGGSACWSQFVRESKLPFDIAQRSPPTAICAAAYSKGTTGYGGVGSPTDLTDPSVVSYGVERILTVTGSTSVISRGALSCWPSQ